MLLKSIAFFGVAGDPVEHRTHNLSGLQADCLHGLVDQQFHHHQLVDGHARDAVQQNVKAFIQLVRWGTFNGQAPLDRFFAVQAVSGEQQAFGLSTHCFSSTGRSRVMPLPLSGRFKVIRAIGPSTS